MEALDILTEGEGALGDASNCNLLPRRTFGSKYIIKFFEGQREPCLGMRTHKVYYRSSEDLERPALCPIVGLKTYCVG
jgi:hypothetical protein